MIIDLWMPVFSGDQIIHMVRKHQAYSDLPIIAISASRDGEKIALDAGATKFIAKPFDGDQLVQTVTSMLTWGYRPAAVENVG